MRVHVYACRRRRVVIVTVRLKGGITITIELPQFCGLVQLLS